MTVIAPARLDAPEQSPPASLVPLAHVEYAAQIMRTWFAPSGIIAVSDGPVITAEQFRQRLLAA